MAEKLFMLDINSVRNIYQSDAMVVSSGYVVVLERESVSVLSADDSDESDSEDFTLFTPQTRAVFYLYTKEANAMDVDATIEYEKTAYLSFQSHFDSDISNSS